MAWRLPEEIVDVCAAHHDPEAIEEPHVRLVMIADLVVDQIMGAEPLDQELLERLELSRADAEEIANLTTSSTATREAD